jgi:integrase
LEAVEQYEARHPIGSNARLALALLLYTGARRSDIVLLGRQHVKDGWIKFIAQKNQKRRPVTIELPMPPTLATIIDATITGALTFLVTEYGKPFTAAGFGAWFRKRCDEANLPGCSAHGLCKAGAARAAENGATAQELMAIFGWLSLKEAERYTAAPPASAQREQSADARHRRIVNEMSPPFSMFRPHLEESVAFQCCRNFKFLKSLAQS